MWPRLRRSCRTWSIIFSIFLLMGIFFILRLLDNQKDYIDRKGIHVVVGHYIGDSVDPMKTPNITKGMSWKL